MNSRAPDPPLPPRCRPRLAPGVRRQTDRVSGRPTLLYPEGVLLLNPTGAAVVELCDGRRTLEDIIAILAARFAAPPERVGPDVTEYLLRLYQKRLMVLDAEEVRHE
jgi:pyrroloquinoline quinone biosynthesis protein D